jgi:hypothetical protein
VLELEEHLELEALEVVELEVTLKLLRPLVQ